MKSFSYLITAALLLIGGVANAQMNAEEVVKATVDKMKAHKNIEVSFDYQILNAEAGINETQKGKGYMQGESYRLEIAGQQIISNGKTTWTYVADNEEVMISNANQEDTFTPMKLLTTYNEKYNAKFIPNGANEKNIKTIEMISTEDKNDKVVLKINDSKMEIVSASVFDENDNQFIIKIKELVTDKTLPNNFFIFDSTSYPEVEVIDMR